MKEFDPPRDAERMPEEFPAPGPEFTPVGQRAPRPDAQAARRRRKKRLIYAILAAALVMTSLGPFRLFSGSGDAAPRQPAPGGPAAPTASATPAPLWPFSPGGQAPAPPELTASFTAEPGGEGWFWLDYTAEFLPAEDDDTPYAPEVYRFGTYCYDKTGAFLEGVYVSASGIPDMETAGRGWRFRYSGPANGEFPEGTETIAVWLQLRDTNSGEIYEVITEAAVPPETPVIVTPDVEIYVTSFYSEFRGKLIFHDMDTAESVTLQYWDPETHSCDAEFNITQEALEDGVYNIEPFSTDFVYEKHQEYYEERNSFPMKLGIKVLVSYAVPEGLAVAEFEADSMNEVGWDADYIPSDFETWTDWLCPGCFQVQVKDCPEPYAILYDEVAVPGAANTVIVRMKIDGEAVEVDPDALTMLHTEYDASTYENGEWIDHHFHTSLLVLPVPEGYAEGEGHVANFTIIQYLTGIGKPVAFEQNVEF